MKEEGSEIKWNLKKSNFKSEPCCKQHSIERKGQMEDFGFN